MRPDFLTTDEIDPLMDESLSSSVFGVGLAGDHQLHRSLCIREQSKKSLGIMQQQIGSLISRESAGEAEG
jgi:hypothetical protein